LKNLKHFLKVDQKEIDNVLSSLQANQKQEVEVEVEEPADKLDQLGIDDLDNRAFESRLDELLFEYEDEVRASTGNELEPEPEPEPEPKPELESQPSNVSEEITAQISDLQDFDLDDLELDQTISDEPAPKLSVICWNELDSLILEYLNELGSGEAGSVWKVDCAGSILCAREIPKDLQEQTIRNVKQLFELSHPHLEKYYGTVERESKFYILHEFIDGTPLDQLLKTAPLDEIAASHVLNQILSGLEYLHDPERQIVHCNLKVSCLSLYNLLLF